MLHEITVCKELIRGSTCRQLATEASDKSFQHRYDAPHKELPIFRFPGCPQQIQSKPTFLAREEGEHFCAEGPTTVTEDVAAEQML